MTGPGPVLGETIVLLHGATSSARIWQPLLPTLAGRHRIVTPTLAGHRGGPPVPAGGGTVVERIVDDMCEQLDDAGIRNAHLVGNSLGGWVALELARRGRARSVLAFSPAGAWDGARDLRRLLRIFRAGAIMRRRRMFPGLVTDPRLRRVVMRSTAEHADRLGTAQAAAIVEDLIGCDVLTELITGAHPGDAMAALQPNCPVRIVWAEKDRTLPFARYGRPMLAAVRGAELEVMAGVGHVPMIDDPAAVSSAILEFVDDVVRRRDSQIS